MSWPSTNHNPHDINIHHSQSTWHHHPPITIYMTSPYINHIHMTSPSTHSQSIWHHYQPIIIHMTSLSTNLNPHELTIQQSQSSWNHNLLITICMTLPSANHNPHDLNINQSQFTCHDHPPITIHMTSTSTIHNPLDITIHQSQSTWHHHPPNHNPSAVIFVARKQFLIVVRFFLWPIILTITLIPILAPDVNDASTTTTAASTTRTPTKWKCDACFKSFSKGGNLKRHLHTFHNPPEVIFTCSEVPGCRVSFFRKDQLTQHIAGVHKKQYKCSKCTKLYGLRWQLRDHERKLH